MGGGNHARYSIISGKLESMNYLATFLEQAVDDRIQKNLIC